jgi:hypothetical protein
LLGKYKKKQIAKREKAARIVKEKGNTISAWRKS